MMPVLFEIPGIGYEVPGYGLMLMIGFLLSIMWAANRALKSGANPDVVLNCGFLALLGGVVGARAMYVVHYWPQFAYHDSPIAIALAVIDVRKGGLEVYGGVLMTIALVGFYLWRWKHSMRWYLDIMAPSAALGMAIGRVGCLLNGCCWGGVCAALPWAIQFPFGSPPMMQQWSDRVPGAGLPQELMITSVFPDGSRAIPIPRETMRLSDAELDAGRARYEETILEQTADLRDELRATSDPAERTRIEDRIQKIALKSDFADKPYLAAVVPLMSRFDLSAAELRALASKHASLPVHPTQIYAAVVLGLIALLLHLLYWRRTRDGQVILMLLLIEPPTRWLIEMLRADNPVDTAGFTISQFLAVCIMAIAVLGLLWLRSQPPRSPRAQIWTPEEEAAQPSKA